MDRLHEPYKGRDAWRYRQRRDTYIARQCVSDFQLAYFERFPDILESLAEPGLALEWDARNDIVVALHRNGGLPKAIRQKFAARLIDYCIRGSDAAVLWSPSLRSLLSEDEEHVLRERLLSEVLPDPAAVVGDFVFDHDGTEDPEGFSYPLEELANALEEEFPDDDRAALAAEEIRQRRLAWVEDQDELLSQNDHGGDTYRPRAPMPVPLSG